MNKLVILDLDDTLINTQFRHFKVVHDYFTKFNNNIFLDFNDYVKFKKCGKSNIEILKLTEKRRIDHFNQFWLTNIENDSMLKYDTEIIDNNIIHKIKNDFQIDFIVISLRSNYSNAQLQIKNFSFKEYIKHFYFLPHSNIINPKDNIIKNILKDYEILYFIGDSYSDYEASKNNRIQFIQVKTGFKSFLYNITFDNINIALNTLFK
jgi:phosphoglycolate phosphatase-like HAD superfamily hydrolase